MGKKKTDVMVLLSGGIDSAACLDYYLKEKFDVKATFVGYGQKAKSFELKSAKKISKFYNVKLTEISLKIIMNFSSGEIICRNAFLILTTLMHFPKFKGIISLGIHMGTPYYDCSESFVKLMNQLLHGYLAGKVLIDAPFLNWNKSMIIEYCKDNNVPLELTYSCENGTDPPCGVCLSCRDREVLNVR